MKKNKLFAITAITAAFVMAATACGAPAADTTTAESTTAETTTAAGTEKSSEKGETTTADETTTAEETTTEEETTAGAAKAGALDGSGKFIAANGKFEIVLPKDWTVDSDSDESDVYFASADGSDYIEVTFATEGVKDMAEVLPASGEEYLDMISRGEDFELTNYKVTDHAGGTGQTYEYSIKYNSSDTEDKYYRVSGYYDEKESVYINAAATVTSDNADAVKAIDSAMDSFKIIK